MWKTKGLVSLEAESTETHDRGKTRVMAEIEHVRATRGVRGIKTISSLLEILEQETMASRGQDLDPIDLDSAMAKLDDIKRIAKAEGKPRQIISLCRIRLICQRKKGGRTVGWALSVRRTRGNEVKYWGNAQVLDERGRGRGGTMPIRITWKLSPRASSALFSSALQTPKGVLDHGVTRAGWQGASQRLDVRTRRCFLLLYCKDTRVHVKVSRIYTADKTGLPPPFSAPLTSVLTCSSCVATGMSVERG